MTVYRVGPRGATVYTPDGRPRGRLGPGFRVVEDVLDEAEAVAARLGRKVAEREVPERRRVAGRAAGKRLRDYEDKTIIAGRDLADKGGAR